LQKETFKNFAYLCELKIQDSTVLSGSEKLSQEKVNAAKYWTI
jgi:hypothetical protein